MNTMTNQIKIISLVPEGNKVKKGEIVCKFDASEIEKKIAEQQIKVKQALSKIETRRRSTPGMESGDWPRT